MRELLLHNIFLKMLLIIISCWLNYEVLSFFVPKERDLYKYKIKYFYINFIACILYVSFFIIFIFVIRTRVLDKDINLYVLYQNYRSFLLPLNYTNIILLNILILCIIILITIIFKEINELFVTQIIKRYIYIFFGTNKGYKIQLNTSQISIKAFYIQLYNTILDILYYLGRIKDTPQIFPRFFNVCKFIVLKLPAFLILLYFFYELKYNHGVLSSKFNSWFFMFLLYSLYKRITNYVGFSNYQINEMVFNMYYRDRSIKYVNMPKDWENMVYKYVDEGLSFHTYEKYELFTKNIGLLEFLNGMYWRYTWTSTDGYNYINAIGEDFQEENNESLDMVHYPYENDETTFNKDTNNASDKTNNNIN